MQTLIIHDSAGKILMTVTGGDYTGVTAIAADVPDGCTVERVENGEPVIVPIPNPDSDAHE